MKVVHISSSDSGGAGIAAQRLNKALCDIGVDSRLLCVHKSSGASNVEQFKIPLSRKLLYHSRLPIGQNKFFRHLHDYECSYEAVSFPLALYDISDSEIVKNADIINLHWVGNVLNYPRFFSTVKKPIVWTLHDMNPFMGIAHYIGDCIKNQKFNKLEDKIEKIKFDAISKSTNLTVVNLCEWMWNYSSNSKMFKTRHHVIIPNSINIETFNIKEKQAARKLLGLPLEEKVLLFCAQSINNQRKGFDLLLEALNYLKHPCTLAIVGSADNIIFPKGISMRFFGTVHDELLMSMIYAASDAFILPSREDNLPNTMLESLSCGTPVISFANGGMSDVITNRENGLLVFEQTGKALADCINQYLSFDDAELFNRNEISLKAHEMFNPNKQANAYLSLYRDLLK